MPNEKIQDHAFKELLKEIVKRNYPDNVKNDLMAIIDIGETPEEICKATIIYFSTHNR